MKGEAASVKNKKIVAILKLILLAGIIAGIPAFLYFRYGSDIFSTDTVSRVTDYLRANRRIAAILIIVLQIVQVIICILPGQPIQFASSYVIGIGPGFVLSLIGAVLGTAASFYLAKFLGSDAMHLFFEEEKITEYQNKLNSGLGLMIAFLIYLIPGVPKDLVSYAAGISEVRFRPFLLVSTIGRIPGMLGSLLLGHFFGRNNTEAMIILAVAVALILAVCLLMRERIMLLLDGLEARSAQKEELRHGKR